MMMLRSAVRSPVNGWITRERQHAEDRDPDDELAAEAIADRPVGDGAGGDRREKHELADLRILVCMPKRSMR